MFASAAWVQDNKLKLLVQIVEEHISIVDIIIEFNDGKVVMQMIGDAEDFLKEYNGYLIAE